MNVSNTRAAGENGGMVWAPDHFAPMTWHRCITEGCTAKLDPWEHRIRCVEHQSQMDAQRERAHAIVKAAAEAERRHRLSA